jgi:hypothetical protein
MEGTRRQIDARGIEVTGKQGRRHRSYWMTLRKGEDTLI